MSRMLRYFVWIGAWTGAFWGVLQLAHLHTSWDHAVCGPWGCGPTASALVSCHVAWFMVLLPVCAVGNRWLSVDRQRQLGLVLVALAAAIVVGAIAREAATWLPAASDYQRPYFVQRCLFAAVTWTDLPILQMGVLGVIWLVADKLPRHEASAERPAPFACDGDQPAPHMAPQARGTQ